MKAVILAGGQGTRLWPLSRTKTPKQFQKLVSNQSMLQDTLARLNFLKPEDIYIATNADYFNLVTEQCPQIPRSQVIIEPAMRDTASCIGLAAAIIEKHSPQAVMAVIYSDHLIQNHLEFQKKLLTAAKIAQKEKTLNIIEVKAKFPSTTLGYVKIGKLLKKIDGSEIYTLERFIEKPDLKTAKTFLNSFKYLWNTGYYVFRTDIILQQYQKYLPQTYQNLMKIQTNLGTKQEEKAIQTYYPRCPKISIDYGIMEKVPPRLVRIIPADFGWSDVGTWAALFSELAEAENTNIIRGQHLGTDNEGCLIYNETPQTVTTLGAKNLIIINTPDVVFIADKSQTPDLKKLIELLKKKHHHLL